MQVAQRGLPDSEPIWTAIGQTSNQLILYHPPSHALTVQPYSQSEGQKSQQSIAGPSKARQPLLLSYDRPSTPRPNPSAQICPYCSQPLPPIPPQRTGNMTPPPASMGQTPYFQILEKAHEGSRPPTPRLRNVSLAPSESDDGDPPDPVGDGMRGMDDEANLPSRGYYERFFQEEKRLGMGAEGTVFLATHIIGDNVLGTYAVKKIAVGESKDYLVRMLREVRLLETLRHPNIIPYHHSWIEPTHFSAFGPPINALHVLMMYATAGNLDTFLLTRSHAMPPNALAEDIGDADSLGQLPKFERIKAFKKRRASGVGKKKENRGVMMLGVHEILSLFGDVVDGLAFLHSNSIVHLDLKCSNVLLHWVEGELIPKAMISDFGTSEELLLGQRQRTGHTGTMEYMAPETLTLDPKGQWRPTDSHTDMWSLGMILHKLLFLHLPFENTVDYDDLEAEILRYPGFIPSQDLIHSCERRHVPRSLLLLLSKLICVDPNKRPTADKVRVALSKARAEPVGVSRGGALVQRGFAGLAGAFGGSIISQQDQTSGSRSDQRWQDDWQASPVQSLPIISAKPASGIEPISTPPPSHRIRPRLTQKGSRGIEAFIRRYDFELRAAIFICKIMSLQPALMGEKPPIVVFGLIMLALWDLRAGYWAQSIAMLLVHGAIVYVAA